MLCNNAMSMCCSFEIEMELPGLSEATHHSSLCIARDREVRPSIPKLIRTSCDKRVTMVESSGELIELHPVAGFKEDGHRV